MKIFKLISGILILFVVITGVIVFISMGIGAETFLNALIIAAEIYGILIIGSGLSFLVWFACHLIDSALKKDDNVDTEDI